MTTNLSSEYKLLQKAQKFAKGELPPENQKTAKLLGRIAKNPDEWLATYQRFNDIPWASEVFLLALDADEQNALVSMLERMGIKGIRLNSSEGYKALAINGVQEYLNDIQNSTADMRHELEAELKAVIRFDRNGIVVSGYKRGWPFTTYADNTNHFHKLYLDDFGRFETVNRAIDSKLNQRDELLIALMKVEKALTRLREDWLWWNHAEDIKLRISNLERYSDTGGALT